MPEPWIVHPIPYADEMEGWIRDTSRIPLQMESSYRAAIHAKIVAARKHGIHRTRLASCPTKQGYVDRDGRDMAPDKTETMWVHTQSAEDCPDLKRFGYHTFCHPYDSPHTPPDGSHAT